jgi:hypothetical protein
MPADEASAAGEQNLHVAQDQSLHSRTFDLE